jgi:hypothetical protein
LDDKATLKPHKKTNKMKTKWMVFWTIVTWGLSYIFYYDDFGFANSKPKREIIVLDTLSKEFNTKDSAIYFKDKAGKYIPKGTNFIGSIWIDSCMVCDTSHKVQHVNFKLKVK